MALSEPSGIGLLPMFAGVLRKDRALYAEGDQVGRDSVDGTGQAIISTARARTIFAAAILCARGEESKPAASVRDAQLTWETDRIASKLDHSTTARFAP